MFSADLLLYLLWNTVARFCKVLCHHVSCYKLSNKRSNVGTLARRWQHGSELNCQSSSPRGSQDECLPYDESSDDDDDDESSDDEDEPEDVVCACLAARLAAAFPLPPRPGTLRAAFPRPLQLPSLAAAFPRPVPLARLPTEPARPLPLRDRLRVAQVESSTCSLRGGRCTTTSILATYIAATNASRQETALKLFPIKSITSKI